MKRRKLLTILLTVLMFISLISIQVYSDEKPQKADSLNCAGVCGMSCNSEKSDAEWRAQMTDEEYRIMREKGTEMAFTGKYYKHKEEGTYTCNGCGNELFSSETKYESGSGWPSFWEPISDKNIKDEQDNSHLMVRTEVLCNNCGAHLGHVFEDGPKPTGLRYCINSASLNFIKKLDK